MALSSWTNSDVFTEDPHSVYQWFYFAVIPFVQFEVIREQQMIDLTVICCVFPNIQWWLRPAMLQPRGLLLELAWVLQWSVRYPCLSWKTMQQCTSIHIPWANVDSNTRPTRYISAITQAYTMTSANKMANTLVTIHRVADSIHSGQWHNNTNTAFAC